jgi:hypothetical protein
VRRLAALLLLVLCALSLPARAQGGVEVTTQVSAQQVEVGEPFQVMLNAFSATGELPSAPRLKVPPGLSAQGPSISQQQQVTVTGGAIQQRIGISASWVVVASRPGRFNLGPPSVHVGSRQAVGRLVVVEVVARGQGRRRNPFGSPFDPFDRFDPFGGLGPFPAMPRLPPIPGWDQQEPGRLSLPAAPEAFRVDHAPDRTAFLRVVVEPKQAVIGQPLLYGVYAYGRQGPFKEGMLKEGSRPDFLMQPIIATSEEQQLYGLSIGGEEWATRKIRELVLFPLRTGRLTIGPTKMAFAGQGYIVEKKTLLERESPALEVVVSEPPVAGRPSGYQLGDVGKFELSATVEPRECRRGESVSVVVKLSGSGNFPLRLRLPQQRGVEWLEPTVSDELVPANATISGTRHFTYVVRVDREGRFDLGEIRLPFWDPDRQAYATARNALGFLVARPPDPGKRPDEAVAPDPLKNLVEVRKRLGAIPIRAATTGDNPWFWSLLGAGPLGVVLLRGGVRGGRWLGRFWRTRRRSSQYLAAEALGEARRASLAGDPGRAASALERALYLGVEGATGLRARALLRPELGARLSQAGLATDLCETVCSLLDECDALRFTGSSGEAVADLVARGERTLAALGRVRPASDGSPAS